MSNPGFVGTDGDGSFISLFGRLNSTTETEVQCKFYTAFTCTDLRVEFTVLIDTNATVTLRDDEADTTVSVAVTATGWTEDLTDSATVAANSLMCYEIASDGMHGDDITIEDVLLTIEHASITAPIWGSGIEQVGTSTSYRQFISTTSFVTESDSRITFQRATALSNLRINTVSILDEPVDYDVAPFKNGTISSNVIVNILGTGVVEDTTGSESYTSGNTGDMGKVQTTGRISLDVTQIDADTAESWMQTRSGGATTRAYIPFSVSATSTSTNDNYPMRIGSVSAGSLATEIQTAGTGTRDVTLRVGTTNSTNLTINVTGTGYFEDTTGSESVADDDSMTITHASTGGSHTFRYAAVECPWSDPSGPAEARRVMITSD